MSRDPGTRSETSNGQNTEQIPGKCAKPVKLLTPSECNCILISGHNPSTLQPSKEELRALCCPDVGWRDEATCLSTVGTSHSPVGNLSQPPVLRSVKVSPSSLHCPNNRHPDVDTREAGEGSGRNSLQPAEAQQECRCV
ncbi:uncharacterized protein ACNS7B_016472 [Menidia menidia]